MFSKNGFEKTSTLAISKSARIAEGSIYNYFESKAALYEACSDYIRSEIINFAAKIKDVNNKQGELFEIGLKFFKENPDYAKISMVEDLHYAIRSPESEIWAKINEVGDFFTAQIMDSYKIESDKVDMKLLVHILNGGVLRAILSWTFFNEFADIKDLDLLIKKVTNVVDFCLSKA